MTEEEAERTSDDKDGTVHQRMYSRRMYDHGTNKKRRHVETRASRKVMMMKRDDTEESRGVLIHRLSMSAERPTFNKTSSLISKQGSFDSIV